MCIPVMVGDTVVTVVVVWLHRGESQISVVIGSVVLVMCVLLFAEIKVCASFCILPKILNITLYFV